MGHSSAFYPHTASESDGITQRKTVINNNNTEQLNVPTKCDFTEEQRSTTVIVNGTQEVNTEGWKTFVYKNTFFTKMVCVNFSRQLNL